MNINELLNLSIKQIKREACLIAERHYRNIEILRNSKTELTTLEIYARRTHDLGLIIDDSTPVEIALRKLSCPKFWKRNAVNMARLEQQRNDLGNNIGADRSPYTSKTLIKWGKMQDVANQQYLDSTNMINKKTGKVINMGEMNQNKGRIRFAEIYGIVKTMTEALASEGYSWALITLTLPPRYHARPAKGRSTWDGSTPADGQDELKRRWQNVRQAVSDNGIKWYGLRGAEPHKDGCPHWHILALFKPEDRATIFDAFARQVEQSDRELDWQDCDPTRDNPATAATYICKYITKNIDQTALTDATASTSESPQDALKADSIEAVKYWRRTNRIRAFQFFGFNGGITKWRILRKMDTKPKCPIMGDLWEAANKAQWNTFLFSHEQVKINNKKAVNRYGEEYLKPESIESPNISVKIRTDWETLEEYGFLTVGVNDPRGKDAKASKDTPTQPIDYDSPPF